MSQYKVVFSVNGRRTEQYVNAFNTNDAKKIIEAQYAGQKIIFFSVNQQR